MPGAAEIKLRTEVLKLQLAALKKRYARSLKRDAFVKKHQKKILSLKTDGWPRTKEMPDYCKWIDLVYQAKIESVYSIGNANCDVIMRLHDRAKELTGRK